MNWISIKDQPPTVDNNCNTPFVLAYHTVFGIGTGWFHKANDYEIEEWKEEGLNDYIISCDFVHSIPGDGGLPELEECIDIFISSPDFKNLGTVTHWMPLPEPPLEK